jgi:hypothetical protein
MGKGLMLEGFSGSRRVVTVLASDSIKGFNLVRLRRMVGQCHQLAQFSIQFSKSSKIAGVTQ